MKTLDAKLYYIGDHMKWSPGFILDTELRIIVETHVILLISPPHEVVTHVILLISPPHEVVTHVILLVSPPLSTHMKWSR